MKKHLTHIYRSIINPPTDEELVKALDKSEMPLPTLWLIGKTGAGKSSIVQQLTGEPGAQIGNGFMPCTQDSVYYDFPAEHPIIRFLDTRGLGEAGYDPDEDIEAFGKDSHAILVVLRIRDGEQHAVMQALAQIRKSAKHIESSNIIVVHTGAHELSDEHDKNRAIESKQRTVEAIFKSSLNHCVVDFGALGSEGELKDFGADELHSLIGDKLPELSLWLYQARARSAEQDNFDRLSSEVLWYAGVAAASDAIPLVGLVTVPGIQGKLLHSLAQKYDIEWNAKSFSEFTAALGTAFGLRYAVSLGGRQLVKLVPVYGQVAGAAAAMIVSFASTYALGRAACSYLYQKKNDASVDASSIKSIYVDAIASAKATGKAKFGKGAK